MPGALYIKHSISAVSLRARAKLKAIPARDFSKVLDVSVAIRNHGGLMVGMIVAQNNTAGAGNQSTFGVGTQAGAAMCYVAETSLLYEFQRIPSLTVRLGLRAPRARRWDRLSGADKVCWGVLDPFTGVHRSNPIDPSWYGGLGYHGFGYWTTNGGDPIELAFHGFYHFSTSFPAGGMGISRNVSFTP